VSKREGPVRVAVLVSGGGTNLQALLDTLNGSTVARIVRVITNRADAGALDRARRSNIPTTVLRNPADAHELLAALHDVQLVVLAGYLKLVPPAVVTQFRGRIINVHPALLPRFGGPGMYGHHVHQAVLANGAQQSGATVHFVDEVFDHGDIIAQETVRVEPGDTPDSLAARVREAEHRLLPRVVLELARRLS
jgi:formyltetrahydrofolate-dependent phosphoribosylglycinamide formyltransferase